MFRPNRDPYLLAGPVPEDFDPEAWVNPYEGPDDDDDDPPRA